MLVSKRATNILLILILAVGIGIVAMLATGARGGPLDPQGPPSSTYKSLEIVPPIWVLTLPSDDNPDVCNTRRFTCVMNSEAVLDRETGLVWQRDGDTTSATWAEAVHDCYTEVIGGRWSWRLPTWPELMSLSSDTGDFTSPSPFTNVGPGGPGAILLLERHS